MKQKIISEKDNYRGFDGWVEESGAKKILLVCGNSIKSLTFFNEYLKNIRKNIEIVPFSNFQPNPLYESVIAGVEVFRKQSCDAIIAVGGGSAMDVAKCIKLYSGMKGDGMDGDYLNQEIVPNSIPFLAMPTTAGTGSETTRYAVIYYKGVKQSIMSESCIPDTVLLDSNVLKTLPLYLKKATMMDAFCHAIESFWSVNSTVESKEYSHEAIELVLSYMDEYLANTSKGNSSMLMAAHIAGKAINITQTTAGHAMCYKITSLFGCAHGHAAILCNRVLFPWMIKNTYNCIDPRGEEYLVKTLQEIAEVMGCKTVEDAGLKVGDIFDSLELEIPIATDTQYKELECSVNPIRLKNYPIALDKESIDKLYHMILR